MLCSPCWPPMTSTSMMFCFSSAVIPALAHLLDPTFAHSPTRRSTLIVVLITTPAADKLNADMSDLQKRISLERQAAAGSRGTGPVSAVIAAIAKFFRWVQ